MNDRPGQRFLLIQLKRVGDVLLCTPLLRAIRVGRPGARIAFLTEEHNAPLLKSNPNVDSVLTIPHRMGLRSWFRLRGELMRERPEIAVDLSGTPGSCLAAALSGAAVRVGFRVRAPRRWFYNIVEIPDRTKYTVDRRLDLLRAIGIADRGFETEIFLDDTDRREAARLLDAAGFDSARPILAVAPTSRKDAKRWSADGFASLAFAGREELGAEVLLLAGEGEGVQEDEVRRRLPAETRRIGGTPSLRVLAALIERSRLLVANDGGPKHLAAALGIPTVTIFVSTEARSWHPPNDPQHRAVVATENLNATIREAQDAVFALWGPAAEL